MVPAASPSFMVVEAKQNSLKRQRTAEKARMYNKSRKSEVATRMKKVGRSGGREGEAKSGARRAWGGRTRSGWGRCGRSSGQH